MTGANEQECPKYGGAVCKPGSGWLCECAYRPAPETTSGAYTYAPPITRKAKDGYGTRQELLTFARAFRHAVEIEFIDGDEPPLWLRNGYDNAREITGLDREYWPAPWERAA